MDIRDSGIAKNGIEIRSILIALLVYGSALFFINEASNGDATIALVVYLVVVAGITMAICKKEINNTNSESNKFKKNLPFKIFGVNFGDFQHVFFSKENINQKIESEIKHQILEKTPIDKFEKISVVDIDKNINTKESRDFHKASTTKTERGSHISLIFQSSDFGEMRSIRWWVIVGGYVDYNKYFNFVVYSPILFLIWIIPYLKKDFDVLSKLRTIYSSSYNDIDISNYIRCIHETVFCAMVDTLEKYNIDTSDLKLQRSQVMNLNVSGGKVNIGNVVQGTMNKITSAMGRAKAA
ncbi:MAG: hypothetical protein GXO85_00395 [Chlorobi bacterium]|nr:hypothetical protein [Chlorobiota bacterium]